MVGTGRVAPIKQTINRGAKLPPEANPWWWHPSKPAVPRGPGVVVRKLEELDPDLAITKNLYTGNWQIWLRNPKNSVGWTFLFAVHPAELGEGEGVVARLYDASEKRWGNGRKYFDAIQREMEREKAKAEAQSLQDSIDHSMEYFNHSQISVAMRGKSNGSKFSTYHS